MPFSEIASAQDYVLAEAAKPMLGQVGFTIITVAALISTFSAINASLYGGAQVNYEIAEDQELPKHFLAQFWGQPIGLMVTAVATLVLVNTLQLESISTAGSIGFILIFGMVNVVGFRLSKSINGNKIIPLLGVCLSLIALVVLVRQQWNSNAEGVWVSLGIITFCFMVEGWYQSKIKKSL